MLRDWVNQKYFNSRDIKGILKNFRTAKPFPHLVLEDFFDKSQILKVKRAVLDEEFQKIDKDLFSLSHTGDLTKSNNDFLKSFYRLLSSKEFIELVQLFTGAKLSKRIEMQAHLMAQGDYLLFHDDLVDGRRIAYIVYLSAGFTTRDGGALQLYNIEKPQTPIKSIKPAFNSFVCFKVSRKSVHAVEEVLSKKERLTIGGWFYGH